MLLFLTGTLQIKTGFLLEHLNSCEIYALVPVLRDTNHVQDCSFANKSRHAKQGPIHTMRHVSVPSPLHFRSVRMVCVHTVRRVQLPEQHMIGGLRYFYQTCSPIRFLKDS
jgi:hypothetical protein